MRNFIKQCGVLGLSCLGISASLNSCTSVHHVTGEINNNTIRVSKSEFIHAEGEKSKFSESPKSSVTFLPQGWPWYSRLSIFSLLS